MFFGLYLLGVMFFPYVMLIFFLSIPDKLIILNIVDKKSALDIYLAGFLCSVAWPITIVVALIIYFCRAWKH